MKKENNNKSYSSHESFKTAQKANRPTQKWENGKVVFMQTKQGAYCGCGWKHVGPGWIKAASAHAENKKHNVSFHGSMDGRINEVQFKQVTVHTIGR